MNRVPTKTGNYIKNSGNKEMDIVTLGTPFGLAFASGINAYLPLLAYALSVRWLHLYAVNSHVSFITQPWFMVVLALLAILDFIANKIPLLDHAWNAAHTFVRPIAGALVAVAASSHALSAGQSMAGSNQAIVATFSAIPVTGVALLVILLIGAGLAALSHSAGFTARLFTSLSTAGLLNGVLSVIQDILVVILILLSLFASAIMFILLVLLVLFLVPRYLQSRHSRGFWRL
jgi:hypothetical protein